MDRKGILLSEKSQAPKVTSSLIMFLLTFPRWQRYRDGEQLSGCQGLVEEEGEESGDQGACGDGESCVVGESTQVRPWQDPHPLTSTCRRVTVLN